MVTARYLFATFAMCAAFNSVIAAEDKKEETDDANPSSGLLNSALEAADGAKDKMEGGMDVFNDYTTVSMELTEDGAKKSQSFTVDVGDAISADMGKVVEVRSKIKEAVGDAVFDAKDKFETVASSLAEHAKIAVGTFWKLFG
ncbi:hypothetical protein TNIN_463271 [Trichonephila inaurata madagascariensis]|uniref:Uncharacterized protein n=1 Tax=Trichonephila inaurata madagascariensis TaxID=2747483 RepID=A0A8X6XW42_9ARAC|nr:hypothetical protein TNIN_463271 [Trichonephila inaurata madagascariensis]